MATKSKKSGNIIPLGDKILIKNIESSSEKKTASGIIIPSTVKEESGNRKGKVMAIGEGKREDGKLIKPSVKVGDTVLFSWGDEITIDGGEYFIVSEANILAIIK